MECPLIAYVLLWFPKPSETFIFREVVDLQRLGAALCGFHLARRFQQERVTHIHAPWACGPATAAWVASQLTGIPFSFTGRAHDIFTPDSLLPDKIRDAVL